MTAYTHKDGHKDDEIHQGTCPHGCHIDDKTQKHENKDDHTDNKTHDDK